MGLQSGSGRDTLWHGEDSSSSRGSWQRLSSVVRPGVQRMVFARGLGAKGSGLKVS